MSTEIDKYKKKDDWLPEESIDLETLQKKTLHISRIIYVGKNKTDIPKRCLSITKAGKSVAFDIEMAKAVAAVLHKLGDEYVP